MLSSVFLSRGFTYALERTLRQPIPWMQKALALSTARILAKLPFNTMSQNHLEKNFCTIEESVRTSNQNWFQRQFGNLIDGTR
ncbi:hypothetical protein, partial [Pseudomonas sp. 2995-3]|uniref:hypothetical protein n=1 Tax=Pseudomonas sp. 2995-3 TaxID=1712680 RepID=UPI001C451733